MWRIFETNKGSPEAPVPPNIEPMKNTLSVVLRMFFLNAEKSAESPKLLSATQPILGEP